MLKVAEGKKESWRRFNLAPDIPTELCQAAEDVACEAERRYALRRNFGAAMKGALKEVNPPKEYVEGVMYALLDFWEYRALLRQWLNEQAHKALDEAFPCPVPFSERGSLWG